MNKSLSLAAYSGILSIIIILPMTYLAVLESQHKLTATLFNLYILVMLLSMIFSAVNAWGFVIIGKKTKNKLLTNASYLLIYATIILSMYELVSTLSKSVENQTIMIGMFLLFGIIGIPFGIGFLRLKKWYGNLATIGGILWIIASACFFTVFLNLIGSLILVVATIFEIIILFKAVKKY
jgi:hypothetical protein